MLYADIYGVEVARAWDEARPGHDLSHRDLREPEHPPAFDFAFDDEYAYDEYARECDDIHYWLIEVWGEAFYPQEPDTLWAAKAAQGLRDAVADAQALALSILQWETRHWN